MQRGLPGLHWFLPLCSCLLLESTSATAANMFWNYNAGFVLPHSHSLHFKLADWSLPTTRQGRQQAACGVSRPREELSVISLSPSCEMPTAATQLEE